MFRTLAAGLPLDTLVQAGTLVASQSTEVGDSRRGSALTQPRHQVSFYVRQLDTTEMDLSAMLQDFAQRFPVQKAFVDEVLGRPAGARKYVRYVGMCVDGQPFQRLQDDTTQSSSASSSTSRLLNFMATYAPGCQWQTYEITPLQLEVDGFDSMPLDDLLRACQLRFRSLPVRPTRTMVAKKGNAEIAPIEAALIDCCSTGSVCLNSSLYGGLDTLTPVAIPPQAEAINAKVANFCGPFKPADGQLDRDLFERMFDLVEEATEKLKGKPPSLALQQAVALYAAVPSRGLHVLKDVTAEYLAGQATRFGPLAGPGLSAVKHATAWARDVPVGQGRDSLDNLKCIGASADMWPLTTGCAGKELPVLLQLLQNILLEKIDETDYLVIHAGPVLEILGSREGLSSGVENIKIGSENECLSIHNMTQQTATLHVIKVGRLGGAKLPAIATFDAGAIKYRGDSVLRANLHLLCGLTAVKTRLLAYFSALAGISPEDAIRLTQEKSTELGLEAAIVKRRQECSQRYFALHSLQYLPAAIAHARAPDQDFWQQEEKWRKQGQALEQGRQDLVASAHEDREDQIIELMQITNGTLKGLPLPKGLEREDEGPAAIEAWCD